MPGELNPAGFIAQALFEGRSARSALDDFRSAGGELRDQTWYRAWGEVRASLAGKEAFALHDPGLMPDSSLYVDWSAGRAGAYATQLDVFMRDRETGVVMRTRATYISDGPHSPQDAIDHYGDLYSQAGDDEDTDYNQQYVGAVVTGLYRMTGRS